MTEENQVPENTETVREKITPDSLKDTERNGDRSPTKGDRSPTKTERDILSDPEPEAGQQPDAVRDLVKPSADEVSTDDERSPGRTEK